MPQEPILPLCVCGNPKCDTPYGTCHCGCGKSVRLAPQSDKGKGWVRDTAENYSPTLTITE